MTNFNNLKSANSLRRMPKGGPNRSSDINDSLEEILHDLASLYNFVNNTMVPIINGLGAPDTYSDFNPVAEGLDGKTMLTDNDYATETNPFFYNVAQGRPNTVKETALKLSQDVDQLFLNINTINARIGAVSTDESVNPATLSELENLVNSFIGTVRTIQSNTTGYLTASGIAAAISDLTIDPNSFNIGRSDITINAGIRPTDISGIDLTVAYDYSAGIPATYDLTDSLQRVKEFAEDMSGDSIITFAGSGLTGDSLKTHREKVGTGTSGATNPHGLDVGDLDDTNSITARITQIATFDVNISGLQGMSQALAHIPYHGGYSYAPASYTVTRVAGTIEQGKSDGLIVGIYRRRSSTNALIHSGLAIPGSNPGSVTTTSMTGVTDIIAGDLMFVSGLNGDGHNARVFIFGTPS